MQCKNVWKARNGTVQTHTARGNDRHSLIYIQFRWLIEVKFCFEAQQKDKDKNNKKTVFTVKSFALKFG